MNSRLLLHALLLALYLVAGILASYVSPANAGEDRDVAEVEQSMETGMPCCPSAEDAPNCATNCPALTFCFAKCSPSGSFKFASLPRPVIVVVRLTCDDAERASQSCAPLARPPRS